MSLENQSLRGTAPRPPSATACMDPWIWYRHVNWAQCWDDPSDRDPRTWEHFVWLVELFRLNEDLIVFDFEKILDL